MGAKKINLEALVDFDFDNFGQNAPLDKFDSELNQHWQQKVVSSIEKQHKQQKALWQAYIKKSTADAAVRFCEQHHLSKSEFTRILFENFFKNQS